MCMMKSCPSCGRESVRNVQGTNHFVCEACDTNVLHEGNGFISE